jgi:hypothetical protein
MLYDTSVAPARVDEVIAELLDEGVRFVDPWQTAAGKEKYRLGAAGFHSMFRFDFEIHQAAVELAPDGLTGRALVDGVMHLRYVPFIPYPLRTILVYRFTLDAPNDAKRLRIDFHEEMWSLGDMLAAVPGFGFLYSKLFRPAFSVGFLAASHLSSRGKR